MTTETKGATMTRHRIAKFKNLGNANGWAAKCTHPVTPLLGDDGRFWVPATLGDWTRLVSAGYEEA